MSLPEPELLSRSLRAPSMLHCSMRDVVFISRSVSFPDIARQDTFGSIRRRLRLRRLDSFVSCTAWLPAPTVAVASLVPEPRWRLRRTPVAGGACAGSPSLRASLAGVNAGRVSRRPSDPRTARCIDPNVSYRATRRQDTLPLRMEGEPPASPSILYLSDANGSG